MLDFMSFLYKEYKEERQVTKPTFQLQSCRSRTGFRHYRSRSTAVAPGAIVPSYFKGIIFFIHERQVWSGNESVEIQYVIISFVAGTSAL